MRKSVFNTSKKLLKMLQGRVSGLSYQKLARSYGVDHTTIIYWCVKCGVKIGVPIDTNKEIHITLKRKFNKIVQPKEKYAGIIYEKINQGKSYAEYLKEEKARKLKKPVDPR